MNFIIPRPVFDCGSTDIQRPVNGNVNLTEKTTIGSQAIFSCDAGFVMIGEETRTCQLTGWSGSNPICGMSIKNYENTDSLKSLF